MTVIEMKDVYMAYRSRRGDSAKIVLKDLDLKVEENEFVCILGPSGCGKTTLLNLLAGFELPVSGSVTYRGAEVTGPSSDRAVVFQEFSLFPWMDVRSNIEFALDDRKHTPEQKREKADRYLASVGLSQVAEQMPGSLSGGMKQRVAIARTLAMEPDVLLMDEPFSSLDEQTKSLLDTELTNIWNSDRRTVVFVTHSIDEALLMGTRIILLSASPGTIAMEWRLDPDRVRDRFSPEFIRLKQEILTNLGTCSCAARSSHPIQIEGLR